MVSKAPNLFIKRQEVFFLSFFPLGKANKCRGKNSIGRQWSHLPSGRAKNFMKGMMKSFPFGQSRNLYRKAWSGFHSGRAKSIIVMHEFVFPLWADPRHVEGRKWPNWMDVEHLKYARRMFFYPCGSILSGWWQVDEFQIVIPVELVYGESEKTYKRERERERKWERERWRWPA